MTGGGRHRAGRPGVETGWRAAFEASRGRDTNRGRPTLAEREPAWVRGVTGAVVAAAGMGGVVVAAADVGAVLASLAALAAALVPLWQAWSTRAAVVSPATNREEVTEAIGAGVALGRDVRGLVPFPPPPPAA